MKTNYFKLLFLLLFLFLLKTTSLLAQEPYIWQDKDFDEIKTFEILLDKNYTFEQILNDSSLIFQKNPEYYKFETEDYCWFRFSIQNNSVYTKEGYIFLSPNIDNTLYSYNFENKKWETIQLGIALLDLKREKVFFPIVLQAQHINTFYVKLNVQKLNSQKYPLQLFLKVFSKEAHKKNRAFVLIPWLFASLIIGLFFIYNTYIYFIFRDKTYLNYLTILLGYFLYTTSYSEMFNYIQPFTFYNLEVEPNGYLYYYQFTHVIGASSVGLVLFAYVQFTRNYLQLSIYFPLWNKILKYLLYILITLFTFYFFSSFITLFFIEYWLALLGNLLSVITISLIIGAGIYSYRKGHKVGRYFLLANILPLLFIITLTLYFLINPIDIKTIGLFPHLILISHVLSFAIALVARVNLIKDELKEKQLEAKTLQNQNEEIIARNRYIELENEYIIADMVEAVNKEADLKEQMKLEINQKTELEQKLQQKIDLEINQKAELQQKLEANQRELTANSLYLYQKNELLSSLQKQIENLSYKDVTDRNREGIREIKSALKNDLRLENDWDNFKIHFEEVHPNFFKDLKENYPTLTNYEIRLAAYYHLNMTGKEIATLLNIDPKSVHKSKSRLNKKMEKFDKE